MKWLIGIVLTIILLVGGLYTYFEIDRVNTVKTANLELDTANANVVKSSINVYYALFGTYPRDEEDLINKLSDKENYAQLNKEPLNTDNLKKTMQNLKEFNYTVKGDRKAYKFSYKDHTGETKNVEGNYQEDFH